MDIRDNGYRFWTIHNADGDVAHVEGNYTRWQKEAPIRRNQDFELEFYGMGSSIVLGVTAWPRRAVPATMAAIRRSRPSSQGATVANAATLTSLSAISSSPTPPTSPSVMPLTVAPDFQSPFDNRWGDWELDLPPFSPDLPPGGGGGGTYHSAVRIQLFVFGTDEPVETWELPDGVGSLERQVKYEPQGFPTPDAPVRRTTWWRMVVTPLGPDPVEIRLAAHVRIADVPIRVTPLTVRLTDHLFRVALEALVPRVTVNWDKLIVSIGPEIADMLGIVPTILEKDLGIKHSHARLRSLDIKTVSGKELNKIALKHYRERAKRYVLPTNININLTLDQRVELFFHSQLERLAYVQPDDVCIRIQAAFTDATVSVSGFDLASLRGELGELILAFDHRAEILRPFAFLDVDYTTIASIALPIYRLFKDDVPKDWNKYIEDHLTDPDIQPTILKYMKAFLERAVGRSNHLHEFRYQNKAWQIRHSDDPVIPPPGSPTFPPTEGGPLEDGVITLLTRHYAALGLDAEDLPAVAAATTNLPPLPAIARELPTGFPAESEQLRRLDRHQSIVVVMMENRSYDHMLGDLMHVDPTKGYDGPPNSIKNAGVAGMPHGVPIVHTRDLRIGTAIPVSPRHYFNPVQFQMGDGTEKGRSSGDMLGFARDLYHRSDSPQLALTVYGKEELPVHYKLAEEFLTCDRWFSAHPGPTFPNRFATIMGKIPDLENFEIEDPRIGFLKYRNIFDVLSEVGLEWRVFESDLSLIRMFDKYRIDDKHVVPIDDEDDGLEATLRKGGPLPRVMFIEPNFADIPPLHTANDDHPPADLAHGQAFLSRVCDLLWDADRFDEVLLVITYDEHGGFYDHVPPPGTPKSGLGPYPPLIEGGPTWLGPRVPTFVISPYVSEGSISRTIFDHTSILKTILVHNRARLSNNVLSSFGEHVNQANDLSAVLDLASPRQAPVPFIRRAPGGNGDNPIFGDIVDLDSIVQAMPLYTPNTSPPVPGVTPRQVIFTERTNPPDGAAEERDFHAALAKMLKPRRHL
jgi:phospholipase C